MAVKFVVYGVPQHKRRVRSTARSGFVRQYKDPADKTAEVTIANVAAQAASGEMLEGPLYAVIAAYFPIPKSASRKKAAKMITNELRPGKKPDIDNIIKIYLDSCNGIVYDDDKMVVSIQAYKLYGGVPRVEVEIGQVTDVSPAWTAGF